MSDPFLLSALRILQENMMETQTRGFGRLASPASYLPNRDNGAAQAPDAAAPDPNTQTNESWRTLAHRPFAVAPAEPASVPIRLQPCQSSRLLALDSSQRLLSYSGPDSHEPDAAASRANCAIHPSCGAFYFEVKILDAGKTGEITIGLCTPQSQPNRMPGWERNSFGYSGYDGYLHRGTSVSVMYGPVFGAGDIVGCCVDFLDKTVFFTRNGSKLGSIQFSHAQLWTPCIGLKCVNSSAEINFGQSPFMFDFGEYVTDKKERAKDKILRISDVNISGMCGNIIVEYLAYSNYSKTFEKLIEILQIKKDSSIRIQEMKKRKAILNLIESGDIDSAVQQLKLYFPKILNSHPKVMFLMHCQMFIQLVQTRAIAEAIDLGKLCLANMALDEEDTKYRVEVFSLLAYPEPHKSPVAYLLSQNHRTTVAMAIDKIIRSPIYSGTCALERLAQQAECAIDHLQKLGSPQLMGICVKDFM